MNVCGPYKPRTDRNPDDRRAWRGIVLLRHSDGTPYGERPRDFKSYDGKGASAALLLAAKRCVSCSDVYRPLRLDEMALEQIEREQAVARESEAAE